MAARGGAGELTVAQPLLEQDRAIRNLAFPRLGLETGEKLAIFRRLRRQSFRNHGSPANRGRAAPASSKATKCAAIFFVFNAQTAG